MVRLSLLIRVLVFVVAGGLFGCESSAASGSGQGGGAASAGTTSGGAGGAGGTGGAPTGGAGGMGGAGGAGGTGSATTVGSSTSTGSGGGGPCATTIGLPAPPVLPIEPLTLADLDGDGDLDLVGAGPSSLTLSFQDASGDFGAPQSALAPDGVVDVKAADIDGDGDRDLVAVSNFQGQGLLSAWKNDGTGAFGAPTSIALYGPSGCFGPGAVVLADVGGDGPLDAVIACSQLVSVWQNDGTGAFSPAADVGSTPNPTSIDAADLDSDGRADVVVGSPDASGTLTPGTIGVYLATASGGLAPRVSYPATIDPRSVRIADLAGDGTPEVLFASLYDGAVSILPNLGGGTFGAKLDHLALAPGDLVVADLDGDLALDVATRSFGYDVLQVLFGDGSGGLGAPTARLSGVPQGRFFAADMNGDGAVDLVNGSGRTLLNDGAGGFPEEAQYLIGRSPRTALAADLDADGVLDLAVLNYAYAPEVRVLRGLGGGAFSIVGDFAVGSVIDGDPVALEAADLDGDGLLELVTANENSDTLSVLVGLGGCAFQPAVDLPTQMNPSSVARGDFDGDGDLDLVVGHGYAVSPLSYFPNLGNGTFGPRVDHVAGPTAASIAVADFDGDGNLDVALGGALSPAVVVSKGDGAGGFSPPQSFPTGAPGIGTLRVLVARDVDADGDVDLLASDSFAETQSVLRNDGLGLFGAPEVYPGDPSEQAGALGDVDGDGHVDLLQPSGDGIAVRFNDGTGTFGAPVRYLLGAGVVAVVAADFDGDGRDDVAVSSGFDLDFDDACVESVVRSGCLP